MSTFDVAPEPAVLEDGDSAKRRQILEGARQVFLAEGFDGASMGEIAKAAGVSKGTLYVYFSSKEALFAALTIEKKQSLAEVLFQIDADNPDVRSVLAHLGVSFMSHMGDPEHISSVRMVIGAANKLPELGRMFYEAGPCRGIARLKDYLDRQVQAGRLNIEDTTVAAQHFLDLCQSSVMRRLLFAAGPRPTEDEIRKHVDNALRVFFAAYGPKAASSQQSKA
ncbi:TetR/AcrR family transcriptional regulator [Microvirga puerhi]|uniref:TetR/AcrR family transcriptional regulator n=1 Tax=Microvirga puerhi TaxID=2876078 RepID=A0ABS7VS72_9HYPH|nr:TetR/AcrR family transcriptional regulator [Microvirga puerhi]MBZ6077965.1 TetR/AcrR family transcriptional regulator [Microvirga puerhi]